MKYERPSAKYLAGNIVIIYTFFSGFWILCSDRLLSLLTNDTTLLTQLQTVKGWVFVLLTSGLLYGLVRQGLGSLQESNNLLQGIVECTDDAIFVKDCSGHYAMLNSATASHLDKSRSQILGRDDTAFFSPDTAREIMEIDRSILATGETRSFEESVTINGSTRTYHSTKGVYRDSKHNVIGLIGIARDITERKLLLEELKRDKEDLAALNTVTANGISTLNLQELLDVMLGRIMEVMQADAATIRLKKDDTLQVCASIGIENEDYIRYAIPIGQGFAGTIAATRQPLYIEDAQTDSRVINPFIKQSKIRTMLGVPLERNGNLIGVLHVKWLSIHSVSDRKLHLLEITAERCTMAILNAQLYEHALQLQERLQLQIDHMPLACIVNNQELQLTDWNPAAERIFGFTKEEVLGANPCDLITPPAVRSLVKKIFKQLEAGQATAHSINENLTKDGRTIICEWYNTPLKAADGTVVGMLSMAQDITDRHAAEVALQDSEQRYRTLFESNPHPMWVYDTATLAFLAVNDAAIHHYGYSREEFLSMTIRDIRPPEDIPALLKHLSQITHGLHVDGVWRHCKQDGTIIDVEITSHPLVFSGRQAEVVLANDITQRKQAEEQLRRYAFYEPLTGLPNQALFLERLEQQLEQARSDEVGSFAVLFLELERFELVKYSLGHLAADQLIITTARRLEKCLKPMDIVARLGADEFAILLTDIEDSNEATNMADYVHQQVVLPFTLNGREIFSTTSIGIAVCERDKLASSPLKSAQELSNLPLAATPLTCSNQPEDFLRAADTARHHAKMQSHLRHAVFNPAMHEQAVARFQLETDLRRAIEQEQFQVHYQPIVSMETGEISGFEALVRWTHPTRGIVSPCKFIPLAEETGLIGLIDWWVLRQACTQLGVWQQEFAAVKPLTMSVNLSGVQLGQLSLLERLDQILRKTGVTGHSLKLEITESSLLKNASSGTEMLEHLKALGIQLSIDDFGTGYSSLARLHQLPIDTLKIDRSFVSRMGIEGDSLEIVRTIITLAHSLQMDVIAEGIETSQQLAQLRSLGCEYGQGYFFSKPVEQNSATALLRSQVQW